MTDQTKTPQEQAEYLLYRFDKRWVQNVGYECADDEDVAAAQALLESVGEPVGEDEDDGQSLADRLHDALTELADRPSPVPEGQDTPRPWVVRDREEYMMLQDALGHDVAYIPASNRDSQARAEAIAACVNAFDGVSDIAAVGSIATLLDNQAAIEDERNQYLAFLEACGIEPGQTHDLELAAEIAALRDQLRELQEAACAVVADILEDDAAGIDDLGEWFQGVTENLIPHLPDGMLTETLKARKEE
jgi:hypothetical protein